MTDQFLYRSRLPAMLIATRPRRRRRYWSNAGFALTALLLLALAVLSILFVGPSPIGGSAAPPQHRPAARALG
jgi:hypothetical protein